MGPATEGAATLHHLVTMAGGEPNGALASSPFGGQTRPGYRDGPMTRILLVRHGESTWNADGRWQGQADPPLTERGQQQALEAAARIGTVDAIITSDLERAAHTAAILARTLGVDHVASEPLFRERDAGSLSGLTREQIFEKFPGLLPDDPAGHRPGEDGHPRWPDDWESDTHLWSRLEIGLVAVSRLLPDGSVLIVTHGGVIYGLERTLGEVGRPRLANLDGVRLEVRSDESMVVGERVSLIDPSHTLAIEIDRI